MNLILDLVIGIDRMKKERTFEIEKHFHVTYSVTKFEELTNLDLSEDEIGYIALHIGGNLETQKSKRKVISCVILFPQYYDFSNKMMDELKNHYQEQLEIKTVITSSDEIKMLDKSNAGKVAKSATYIDFIEVVIGCFN